MHVCEHLGVLVCECISVRVCTCMCVCAHVHVCSYVCDSIATKIEMLEVCAT